MERGAPRPTSLLTDHYELTMVRAALASGVGGRRSVFEVFARGLPEGRRYGVLGGLGRLLDVLERFEFGAEEIDFLRGEGFLDEATLDWLADYRFNGSIDAYAEGELYFPGSPVLTVEAPFAEAVVLETIVLSILNHDSAVASAAARMVGAADGRPLIDMGSRRTDEEAAVHAARIAYLTGFVGSSNLEAGRRWGVPTRGTAAHAFTLAHLACTDSDQAAELAAFSAQVEAMGPRTTLLVDTFDIEQGVRNAVAAAGTGLGAIRIDSGDLAEEAARARRLLDSLGATGTRIVVSGDMDEFTIEELVTCGAPVDAFGVGTRLVTGSGAPTASFVFKLVAIEGDRGPGLRPVAKRSLAKASVGGRKVAWRLRDDEGFAKGERVVVSDAAPPHATTASAPQPGGGPRPLQQRYVEDGKVVHHPGATEIREHHRAVMAELRPLQRSTQAGPPLFIATVER